MLERVLKGSPKYYAWLCFLLAVIGYAFVVYVFQLIYGLKLTGLSRPSHRKSKAAAGG